MPPHPYALLGTSVRVATLALEAQAVVAYRAMGMAGIWAVCQSEKRLMIEEKPPDFLESWLAAGFAVMGMKPPLVVLEAALSPLSRTTRANRERLAQNGFKQ